MRASTTSIPTFSNELASSFRAPTPSGGEAASKQKEVAAASTSSASLSSKPNGQDREKSGRRRRIDSASRTAAGKWRRWWCGRQKKPSWAAAERRWREGEGRETRGGVVAAETEVVEGRRREVRERAGGKRRKSWERGSEVWGAAEGVGGCGAGVAAS